MSELLKRIEPAYILMALFTGMLALGLAYGGFGQVLSNGAVICLDCIGLI